MERSRQLVSGVPAGSQGMGKVTVRVDREEQVKVGLLRSGL